MAILFNFVQRRHTWRSSAPFIVSFSMDALVFRTIDVRTENLRYVLFDVRMSSFCLASFLATLLRNDYSFLFSSIILTVSFSFWSFHSKVDPISYHRLPFYTRVCIIDDKHNKFAISRYKSYERRIISYSTNSFNSVLCMCMCMCMLIVFFVRGWYKVVQGDWKFGWLKRQC